MKGLIGILGGMGPAATVDCFDKLVKLTPATCDQQHIPVIISSIPTIPDRTEALLGQGESPLPYLKTHLKLLENAGAQCIIMPCNTAHVWFDELKEATTLTFLNIVDATIDEATKHNVKNIGLLGTNATIATKLYQTKIEKRGLNCLIPDEKSQQAVMKSIYLLKSGQRDEATALMNQQAQALLNKGVEIILLACTEIPIILAEKLRDEPKTYIESTGSLVRKALEWYHQQSESSSH